MFKVKKVAYCCFKAVSFIKMSGMIDAFCLMVFFSEVGDLDYDIQRHNSPGLVGCVSGVRYNIFAPLKAYFRPNVTSPPVTTQGYVVESNCAAFTPVLGYVPWEDDPWFTGLCKTIAFFLIFYY